MTPVSPCVSKCSLNHLDVCVGCGRTLLEIASWSTMSEDRRNEVMDRLFSEPAPVVVAHGLNKIGVRRFTVTD